MSESLLLGVASILVLGIVSQWLAWRIHVPSILLLLIAGFLTGPVTGFLDPDKLLGNLIFPIVSLSVGVILFEGGLSLKLDELREVGRAVSNLITIGVVTTWTLASLFAHWLLGFSWTISIVLGSILVVTGPTVIIPLLRHVRPVGRVGAIAKWEGIMNDPVGAILAVLVTETAILFKETVAHGADMSYSHALTPAIEGLLQIFFISVGISICGAVILVLLLKRRMLPDYLQNSVALMVVVGAYALSDVLQHESGLLTTTLMGIALANQKFVTVQKIIEFKEDLRVLIIGALFIMLSARLNLSDLQYIDSRSILFLVILIVLIRPAAVFLSSIGTKCSWKEQAMLAFLAPRGIVAAAVISIFSFRLMPYFPQEAKALVPLVFLVIIGTVTVYSLGITPLARWLGLAQPNPQGLLIVGAHTWAQKIAQALHERDFKVLLIDSNPKNVKTARSKGLMAQRANALSQHVIDELDLGGIGRLFALTPNDEVNALSALYFNQVFDSSEIYQLAIKAETAEESGVTMPKHLRGHPLFGKEWNYGTLSDKFAAGGKIIEFELTEEKPFKSLIEEHENELIPLFLLRASGTLAVYSADSAAPTAVEGDRVLALVIK